MCNMNASHMKNADDMKTQENRAFMEFDIFVSLQLGAETWT
jgi:hypothetical protein